MSCEKLFEYLDQHRIRYTVTHHSPAFTAQEIAAAAHVHGNNLAKTVIAEADAEVVMLVMPAPWRIDFDNLAEQLKVKQLNLASEARFRHLFTDCEIGAMPPFGNLYGIRSFLSSAFESKEEIVFTAGNHTLLVHMPFADYLRLTAPQILLHGFIPPSLTPPRMSHKPKTFFNFH